MSANEKDSEGTEQKVRAKVKVYLSSERYTKDNAPKPELVKQFIHSGMGAVKISTLPLIQLPVKDGQADSDAQRSGFELYEDEARLLLSTYPVMYKTEKGGK